MSTPGCARIKRPANLPTLRTAGSREIIVAYPHCVRVCVCVNAMTSPPYDVLCICLAHSLCNVLFRLVPVLPTKFTTLNEHSMKSSGFSSILACARYLTSVEMTSY